MYETGSPARPALLKLLPKKTAGHQNKNTHTQCAREEHEEDPTEQCDSGWRSGEAILQEIQMSHEDTKLEVCPRKRTHPCAVRELVILRKHKASQSQSAR